MKLPARLALIASLIDESSNVYDVGCDHGLLDIYLTLNKKNKCVASDINENALSTAKKNIKEYNLEKEIEIVVSDGIKELNIESPSTVVISGMGAFTILDILNNPKIKNIDNLIIQSNNHIELLRKEISKTGFFIENEIVVLDRKRYYVIIKFKKGSKTYSKKDLYLGPVLKTKEDSETKSYYKYLLEKNIEILNNIKKGNLMKKIKISYQNKLLKRVI